MCSNLEAVEKNNALSTQAEPDAERGGWKGTHDSRHESSVVETSRTKTVASISAHAKGYEEKAGGNGAYWYEWLALKKTER